MIVAGSLHSPGPLVPVARIRLIAPAVFPKAVRCGFPARAFQKMTRALDREASVARRSARASGKKTRALGRKQTAGNCKRARWKK